MNGLNMATIMIHFILPILIYQLLAVLVTSNRFQARTIAINKFGKQSSSMNYHQTSKLFTDSVLSKSLQSNRFTSYYYDDLSKYSIKYHSCENLKSFTSGTFYSENEYGDDDESGDNNHHGHDKKNYVTAENVVTYRVCPSDSCQDNSWNGCSAVYGTYLISLEDYIRSHEEYEKESLEQFCDYCDQCDYFFNNFNGKCELYDSCENYTNLCYQEGDTENCEGCENDKSYKRDDEFDYSDFLECTALDVLEDAAYYNQDDDGSSTVYLKMICDGSIKLGMFSDYECSNYVGDSFSIFNTTGLNINDEYGLETYFFQTHECISCSQEVRQYHFLKIESKALLFLL